MRIVVPMKAVPDLVEELEITSDGTDIDREYLKFVLNEWDDQALEEALLLKEALQAESRAAEVVAVGLADDPDIEQALYTAIAKGADSGVKLTGGSGASTHARAAAFAGYLKANPADLVITGVQAPDDLDGQLPSALAAHLEAPHVSVVVAVEATGSGIKVRQEFSGGRAAELEVGLPAVIGLQAARQTPRYAPITKIRQTMQAGGLAEAAAGTGGDAGLTVRRMYAPESSTHAEMLDGSPEEVADRIVELLRGRGLVKG
ncbi:MAG TPA: electron transfer flavoprotein subunit beta/FixA family protein [Sporichthya sp.]|nr:electron transfer flavoprotein subunit beta/FixA family protein [Sporichthya sp.]